MAECVASWLTERHYGFAIQESGQKHTQTHEKPSVVVVLGGDGTIIGVGRQIAGSEIPIFGINFGKVGFLTTADRHDWREKLALALAGVIPKRSCLVLRWHLDRCGQQKAGGIAVNDLFIGRGCLARLAGVGIKINGTEMGVLRCDGVIVTTPLGSSGYSVSAGGALLHPGMDAVGLTPVCPFPINVAPLVFPGKVSFELKVQSLGADTQITIDGQEGLALQNHDVIHVTCWPGAIQFLGDDNHFLDHLRLRGLNLQDK